MFLSDCSWHKLIINQTDLPILTFNLNMFFLIYFDNDLHQITRLLPFNFKHGFSYPLTKFSIYPTWQGGFDSRNRFCILYNIFSIYDIQSYHITGCYCHYWNSSLNYMYFVIPHAGLISFCDSEMGIYSVIVIHEMGVWFFLSHLR